MSALPVEPLFEKDQKHIVSPGVQDAAGQSFGQKCAQIFTSLGPPVPHTQIDMQQLNCSVLSEEGRRVLPLATELLKWAITSRARSTAGVAAEDRMLTLILKHTSP